MEHTFKTQYNIGDMVIFIMDAPHPFKKCHTIAIGQIKNINYNYNRDVVSYTIAVHVDRSEIVDQHNIIGIAPYEVEPYFSIVMEENNENN